MTPSAAAHHCVCPQEVRALNHKKGTAKWWQDPIYREISGQFLKDHPICEYCGKPSSVVHHDNANSYRSQEEYYNPANFTPACARCHHEYRQGKKICPECRQHYIARANDKCRWCRGIRQPGHSSFYSEAARRSRQRHPCGNRAGQQRCQRNGRLYVCAWSASKCRACDHFREKGART